jgi:hypothetical protein
MTTGQPAARGSSLLSVKTDPAPAERPYRTSECEPRDVIVDRARRGNGSVTPGAHQSWSLIERQVMLEQLGVWVEIRDALIRIGDVLENRGLS